MAGMVRYGAVRVGEAWSVRVWLGAAGSEGLEGKIRFGWAGHGRRGEARSGKARTGPAGRARSGRQWRARKGTGAAGGARRGRERLGEVGLGLERQERRNIKWFIDRRQDQV
jgi:hypothetical protein